jgi:hypothetical protein
LTNGHSPIRWDKVLEGRSAVGIIDDATKMQQMFELFLSRQSADDGLSTKELSLILFPNETYYSKKRKRTEPHPDALNKADEYIKLFRKWLKNKSIVLYAVKNENDEWVYFNLPKKVHFREVKKRLDAIHKGLKNNEEKALSILGLPKKQREKLAKTLSQEIKVEQNEKERKKMESRKRKQEEVNQIYV